VFTKLRPFDGWGQFDFDVEVGQANAPGFSINMQDTGSSRLGSSA